MVKENILSDLKAAMKEGQKDKVAALRFLSAKIKDVEIEKKMREGGLPDEEVLSLIRKLVRQDEEAILQYKAGEREDLARKASDEISIWQSYMPRQLSVEDLEKEIDKAIAELGVKDRKGFGQVMKHLKSKLGSEADPKLISSALERKLPA